MAAVLGSEDDDDDPLVRLSERAGLTLAEYEAVAIHASGWDWAAIAKAQHVSENAARKSAERGVRKLRSYVETLNAHGNAHGCPRSGGDDRGGEGIATRPAEFARV